MLKSKALLLSLAALGVTAASSIPATSGSGSTELRESTSASAKPADKQGRVAVAPRGDAASRFSWNFLRHTTRRYPRPGWSVRQGQRMAKKARNVARNRRNHRGGR